jgi:hypothetical protein
MRTPEGESLPTDNDRRRFFGKNTALRRKKEDGSRMGQQAFDEDEVSGPWSHSGDNHIVLSRTDHEIDPVHQPWVESLSRSVVNLVQDQGKEQAADDSHSGLVAVPREAEAALA